METAPDPVAIDRAAREVVATETAAPASIAGPAARRPRPAAIDAALRAALFGRTIGPDHGDAPMAIEGRVPDELRGTLYRNGPGHLELHGRRYRHLFEGDGVVTAIRLADGGARAACRTVDGEGLRAERAAGAMRYGYSAPWWRRLPAAIRGQRKNIANTSVMMWQGRLFALMEAGRPTELCPETLATLGERDLGVIGAMFSAHPHRVDAHRTTYNVGVEYGRAPRLHVYALPDDGAARHLGAIALPGSVMLHDVIVSERHLIAFVSPVRISVPRALTGLGSFESLFQWRPEHGTEIVVAPLAAIDRAVRFTVPAFHTWHFANAHDAADGTVVVDHCRYPDFASFHALTAAATATASSAALGGSYHRARIDVARRTFTSEPVADGAWDFPRIRPGREGRVHQRAWVASGELDTLACIDPARGVIARYQAPVDQALTEPVVVAGASDREDDVWLLSVGHDAGRDRAFVAIFAGERLADGPVARCFLDHHLPITFHGVWQPAA